MARAGQAARHQPGQGPRHRAAQLGHRAGIERRAPAVLHLEGAAPGQRLEEHRPEREHVGAAVHLLAAPLLRRHVGGRPTGARPLPQQVRQPQVEQLDAAVLAQEDVARLQVPVHQPLAVDVRQRARRLQPDLHRLLERQRTAGQARLQGLAAQQLHHQVGAAVAGAGLVERHHALVRQAGGGSRLLLELLVGPLVPGAARPQRLQRHLPAQVAVERLVDRAEAAAPQLPQDLEAVEDVAGPEHVGPGLRTVLVGRRGELLDELRERSGLGGWRCLRRNLVSRAPVHADLRSMQPDASPEGAVDATGRRRRSRLVANRVNLAAS